MFCIGVGIYERKQMTSALVYRIIWWNDININMYYVIICMRDSQFCSFFLLPVLVGGRFLSRPIASLGRCLDFARNNPQSLSIPAPIPIETKIPQSCFRASLHKSAQRMEALSNLSRVMCKLTSRNRLATVLVTATYLHWMPDQWHAEIERSRDDVKENSRNRLRGRKNGEHLADKL